MKTFDECCHYVAKKHGLGKTLVTKHRAVYFTEAANLYAQEKLKGLLEEVREREAIWKELKDNELLSALAKDVYMGRHFESTEISTRIEEMINETK